MLLIQSSMTAMLVGGMAGAYNESKKMTKIFLEKNKHEMFRHPREAQASLQDRMIIAYFKVKYTYFNTNKNILYIGVKLLTNRKEKETDR